MSSFDLLIDVFINLVTASVEIFIEASLMLLTASFFICTIFYAFLDRNFFIHLLRYKSLYSLRFAIFLIIAFPNIYWNINNGWLTLGHTLDNVSIGKFGLEPIEFLNFVFAQLLIVGPIFSLFFLRYYRDFFKLSESFAFLISYSFPILVIVAIESLLVRAHGNWAATSFVSLTVLFVQIPKVFSVFLYLV